MRCIHALVISLALVGCRSAERKVVEKDIEVKTYVGALARLLTRTFSTTDSIADEVRNVRSTAEKQCF